MGDNSLKKGIISGVLWSFGERISAQVVSFVISIILARLLLPDDYGVISIILIVINIANVFVNNGLGESLIQSKEANKADFSTIFYIGVILSFFIYCFIFFLAPVVAAFFGKQILKTTLRVMALKIPISAISTIQHAYVSRNMMFKKFFFSTSIGTVTSGLVGVAMAFMGFGVWALIAQYLINSILDAVILFFTVPWRPSLDFNWERGKCLLSYGWKIMFASLLNVSYSNLKSLVIGRVYSTSDLAFYNRGTQFPSLIITNVDTSVAKVMFPVLSQISEDKECLIQAARKILKVTTYCIFPLLTGLIAISKPLVLVLLTEKWESCIPFLCLACLYFMTQPVQTTNWQIVKSIGRSDVCFKLEIVKGVACVASVLFSMKYGIIAIALAEVVFNYFEMILNMIAVQMLVGYKVAQQIRDILPSYVLSISMFILAYFSGFIVHNNLLKIIVEIVVGISVYLIISHCTQIDAYKYIYSEFRKRVKK